MIVFCCSACQKTLTVKPELANKKVQCPACGRVTTVPTLAAVAQSPLADDKTVPPAPLPEPLGYQGTQASVAAVSKPPTNPPLSQADATIDVGKPPAEFDSSLTDFLAAPQADDELGRLGNYRILKILGHGGMGVVFQAEDTKLKRRVALKAMLPALRRPSTT